MTTHERDAIPRRVRPISERRRIAAFCETCLLFLCDGQVSELLTLVMHDPL